MASRGISGTALSINVARKREEALDVSGGGEPKNDLLALFHGMLTNLPKDALVDHESHRYVSIDGMTPAGRTLLIHTAIGHFGIAGNTVDIDTHKTTHKRTDRDSATESVRLFLIVPHKSPAALLFAERISGRTSINPVTKLFKRAYQAANQGHIFNAELLTEPDAWLEQADLQQVTVVSYNHTSDTADVGIPTIVGRLERRFVPGEGNTRFPVSVWQRLRNRTLTAQHLLGIPDDLDDTEVIVTLMKDDRQKQFALDKVRTPYLVKDIGQVGMPAPSDRKFKELCMEMANDLLPRLGCSWSAAWNEGDWAEDMLDVTLEVPKNEQ